ncbi:MAG: tetratricopeptide repeat protein [Phycisphaerales bacterium]|jgi:tetratricopeptide (TPR) repeat protein|nr:tetratricopeptide repeat protein [Phycisphaerales bacterium]
MPSLTARFAQPVFFSVVLAGCHAVAPRVDTDNTVAVVEMSVPQEVTVQAAEIAVQFGDYDEAMRLFKEVLEENPVATEAFVGIGGIYLAKREWQQAEPVFARAAKLEPRNFEAQYGHGVSLQMMKRFVEAIRAYHRALTIEPEDIGANLNIATTYLQMGRPKSAVVFAQRAVEVCGEDAPSHITLAATYQLLGRLDDALSEYITASELMEDPSPQLMRNIIYLLTKEKRYQEVVNTTEQLVRVDPTSSSYEQLGWAQFRLADYGASIKAYRTAVEFDEENWRALNGVGVNALNTWLLSDRENLTAYEDARRSFRRALALNPDQPKVITLVLRYGL